MNPTGTADAAYDCLLEHRMKKVDVIVQGMQLVATPSRQQTDKLVHATMAMTMPDVKPDMALGMIMPTGLGSGVTRCSSQRPEEGDGVATA